MKPFSWIPACFLVFGRDAGKGDEVRLPKETMTQCDGDCSSLGVSACIRMMLVS